MYCRAQVFILDMEIERFGRVSQCDMTGVLGLYTVTDLELLTELGLKRTSKGKPDDCLGSFVQEDYHRLLTKYAEAENTIDRLRLGAKVGGLQSQEHIWVVHLLSPCGKVVGRF